MARTIRATVVDGKLHPDEALELASGTRVLITIDANVDKTTTVGKSFLATAASLNLEGPSDWSARLTASFDPFPFGSE